MSQRLSDISITGLSIPEETLPQRSIQPEIQEEKITLVELPYLQSVPNIEPYLRADLMVDLLYIMRHDGLENLAEAQYPIERATGVSLEPEETKEKNIESRVMRQNIMDSFKYGSLEDAMNRYIFRGAENIQITPEIEAFRKELRDNILRRGVNALSRLVDKSDPARPESLIFNHSSQDIHRRTQEIEVELIKNEPEVIERDDIQCRCGSTRIQTSSRQLRGADEPETVEYHCVSCKARWKSSAA